MKVTGQWYFHYGYYSNQTMVEKKDSGTHADRTVARQRIRTQIQFIADENLSALLNLEANLDWGSRDQDLNNSKGVVHGGAGGGIDADQATFGIKRAHLDWTIPNTQTKVRMGIQGVTMPTVAFGNPVLNADVAGVLVSSQLTPEIGITGFWLRPYDTTYGSGGQSNGNNSMDEMDVFGFTLPIKTDVVRVSPWAMFALIGKDSNFYNTDGDRYGRNFSGSGNFKLNPYNSGNIDSTTYAWWGGVAFELPVIDPFFVKIDAMMGGLETGDSDYDTFGYLIAANMGYKFSFGSLAAIGWYASGDDNIDDRGTMPIISDDGGTFNPTQVGLAGGRNRNLDSLMSTNGLGMWGIGVKLADVSFVENLKHSVTAMYMGGTNKGDSTVTRRNAHSGPLSGAYYMSSDRLYEINLQNAYKAAENLTLTLDFAYLWLDLGDHWDNKDDTTGNFATMIGVEYAF